ncbi:hypothetical protein FB451DRAFT_383862 [Mycena latifolia]|nr:hypothetical protein FB451DRAFT_383862 [Mycena latifolia]
MESSTHPSPGKLTAAYSEPNNGQLLDQTTPLLGALLTDSTHLPGSILLFDSWTYTASRFLRHRLPLLKKALVHGEASSRLYDLLLSAPSRIGRTDGLALFNSTRNQRRKIIYQNFLDQVKPLKHPQRKLKAAFLEHEVSPEDWPHVQKVLHHARNEDKIRFRISYSAEHKICIVYLIPTPAHEAATHNLTAILSVLIATQSGGSIWRDVVFGGSQTTDISNSGGKNIKEPDQSIYPQRPPGPDSCWPNIVIETGVSESHQRLKNDMHRWFTAAERGRVVKLVILIIIDVKEDEEASI